MRGKDEPNIPGPHISYAQIDALWEENKHRKTTEVIEAEVGGHKREILIGWLKYAKQYADLSRINSGEVE